MATRCYRPTFRKQLTGTPCGKSNCNMAAAAHYADRATLGIVQKTPDQMRTLSGTAWECVDSNPDNDGTNLRNAATALARVGIVLPLRDEGYTWAEVLTRVGAGQTFIAHGDYDRVPLGLRGDREFVGLHSVFVAEFWNAKNAFLVYDSLDDGRADLPTKIAAPRGPIWWPASVLRSYLEAFPGPAIIGAFGGVRKLVPIVPTARVRARPTRASATLAYLSRRARDYVETGGVVLGESISGDARWWRVWLPYVGIGYVHATVGTEVTA